MSYKLLRNLHVNHKLTEYLVEQAVFNKKMLAKISPSLKNYFVPETFLQKFFQLHEFRSDITSFMYLGAKTTLTDRVLLQYERMATTHSLQLRTPFLDPRVVEYLAGTPEDKKICGDDTGILLKAILSNVFPQDFIHRPKVTNKRLLISWLSDPKFQEILNMLKNSILVESGYISDKWLKHVIASPERQIKQFNQIWSILSLETWFRIFINTPSPNKYPDVSLRDLLS